MNPEVDVYIKSSETWPDEMAELRPILLGCGLTEDLRWNRPCYSHGGKNIVILQEMKGFLPLMFFKGALLDDPGKRSPRPIEEHLAVVVAGAHSGGNRAA